MPTHAGHRSTCALLITLAMLAALGIHPAATQVPESPNSIVAERFLDRTPHLSMWPSLATVPGLAGAKGRVVLRFVVDTLGMVVPRSLEVLTFSDSTALRPVAAFLAGSQFRPGERPPGHRVSALVRRTFLVAQYAIMVIGPRDTTVVRM